MFSTLAQLDREEALAKGYWNLSMIILIGLLTVFFLVSMFLLRRWKNRQLKAIEKDRAERRAGKPGARVDAWQASADRYVDHDKLPPEGEPDQTKEPFDDEHPPATDPHEHDEAGNPEEEERDPFGLFADKPYQDPEDEDEDLDGDEDWDEGEGDEPEDKR